jgi:hypothetical protein
MDEDNETFATVCERRNPAIKSGKRESARPMIKSIMLVAIACAMFGLQACFSSSTTEQAATPATCDAQGNNCQVSTTKKSSWGFFF